MRVSWRGPISSGEPAGAAAAGGLAAEPERAGGAARRRFGRLVSSRLLRRAASGAVWSVLGQVTARVLTLVGSILVARQLGVTGFGEYSLVLVTVGMFQNIAGFGLVTTSTKYLAGSYRADPAAAGHVVALARAVAVGTGVVAMLGVAVATPWLARDVLDAPQLERTLLVGSALLLFGPIFGAQLGVLTGLERFRLIAVLSAVVALVTIPLVVAGAAAGGTTGCVAGLVASVALSSALHAGATRLALRDAGIAPRWRGALRERRVLLAYSLPTTLSNVLLGVVTWASSAVLAHEPGGLDALGLFGAANQWRNGIVLVATAAGAALLPLFADLHDSGRGRALRRAFWTSFAASGAACLVVAGGVVLAAPTIVRAYGAGFAGAAAVLVLLASAGALAAPLTIAGNAIAGAGRMWLSLALKVAWGGTLLALAYALRSEGALGLAVAHVAALGVHLLLSAGAAAALLRRTERERAAPAVEGFGG